MHVIVERSEFEELENCEWKVIEETENQFIISAWEKEYSVRKKDCVGYPILTNETGVSTIDSHMGDRIKVYFDKYDCYTTPESMSNIAIHVPRESLDFSEEYD